MTTTGELIAKKEKKQVVTIHPEATLLEAAQLLSRFNIGALVVMEDDGPVGMISERDIVRRAAAAGRLEHILVEEAMTRDLIIGVPEDDCSYVMSIMTSKHIRHLPVIQRGKMVGIVSIGDVVKAQITDAYFEVRNLREYIEGKYPA